MIADRAFFGFIGLVFCSITAAISTAAFLVVVGQVSGYLAGF
jgi:hypothetical protein